MRRRSHPQDDEASDESLLAGMALGDDRAGLVFVRRYQRRLFGLAMTIVADVELAEDVAQEAFIRIYRHAQIYDARRGSVATWALTITRNLAIDALRISRSVATSPDDHLFYSLLSTEQQPEDGALLAEACERARETLSKMPLEQRRVVILATMFGRTSNEIAESEQIPLGTAKSRLRMGMAKLREVTLAPEAP